MLTTIALQAPALVEQGMRWGGPGPFWPLAIVGPILWIALIVAVLLLVRRGIRRRPFAMAFAAGESALATRFANGDIDEQEYRSRLAVLRSERAVRPAR